MNIFDMTVRHFFLLKLTAFTFLMIGHAFIGKLNEIKARVLITMLK